MATQGSSLDYPGTQSSIETKDRFSDTETHGQVPLGQPTQTERTICIAAGAGIALLALQKPLSVRGLVCGAVGATLLTHGLSGEVRLLERLGLSHPTRNADEPSAEAADYYTRGVQVKVSHTIMRPAAELYAFWRDFTNLPKFMSHLKQVHVHENNKSKWVADAPLGATIEWEAEIINDEPDKLIAWRSIGNPDVDNSGSVRFVESPELGATEVVVTIDYIPPAGKVGTWIAKLFGAVPAQQIKEDLRKFKQLMETGEIPTTEGQPQGSCC